MKIIKTYQQLFESKKDEFTNSFEHSEFDNFLSLIRRWENSTGKRVFWGLTEKRFWDMYVRPGYEFLVAPVPNEDNPPRLAGILLDPHGNITNACDNTDRNIDLSIVKEIVKNTKIKRESVPSEVVELVKDLSLTAIDLGYEIQSSWNLDAVTGKQFFVGISSKLGKELLSKGSDFADLIEQLTLHLQDTQYSLYNFVYEAYVEESRLIEFTQTCQSENTPTIFSDLKFVSITGPGLLGDYKTFMNKFGSTLPKGEFDLVDFMRERNYVIKKCRLVFESKETY